MDDESMDTRKYLYLTTTGHKSGNPHEIEIWFVEHEGCYYLVSQLREDSDWVRNIRANPAISIRVEDETSAGLASIPDDLTLIDAAKAKMDAKYGWSDGLVVELRKSSE